MHLIQLIHFFPCEYGTNLYLCLAAGLSILANLNALRLRSSPRRPRQGTHVNNNPNKYSEESEHNSP